MNFYIPDFDTLNRVGIILNFLAGFLLAPDLIGKDKLSQLEKRLKPSFANLMSNLNTFLDKFVGNFYRDFFYKIPIIGDLTRTAVGRITLSSSSNGATGKNTKNLLLVLISMLIFTILLFIFSIILKFSFVRIVLIFALAIFSFLVLIIFLRLLVFLIIKFSQVLVAFSNQDNIFLSFLTTIGIVCFILGNLFQLIATFKPQ
ncbi:hypothetical protein [Scytonema sp. NUACC26]|uniref:hypothetical protein n=1 Tax=Scytonema sp. NUACC26 TaxID=3140176 RepID=UPI0034DBB6BA